ncbi:18.5 kDa class I heat shock protein [Neltuma alba]|uniref:18.5 kDa class I heat shock protein n=1 Tax=Neltuma alba TaxID=207710 RepID=UPI0010A395FA|nr:18.5 kDa class I heat shock protein-like [Prosopis alba]
MSIVPINEGGGGASDSLWWDPMDRLLNDTPFPFSSAISSFVHDVDLGFGSSLNSRLDWRENSRRHVWKVVLPGFTDEDVLVELQDDRMLQVSLESGNFMSRFKIPEDADLQQLKATMNHGVLLVTVPKLQSALPNVRVVEIEGSG